MRRLISILLLLSALVSCAAITLTEPMPGWSTLKEGVTTYKEIYSRYGKPDATWIWGPTEETWRYYLAPGGLKEARFVFVNGILKKKVAGRFD